MADRVVDKRKIGDRQKGSMTIGMQDLVNCKDDFQFVRVLDNGIGQQREWMIRLTK